MILSADYSDEARALWDAATALNRAAAAVSPSVAGLPPLLFFTDPERTPRPWETAARLPVGSAVVYRAFGAEDAVETGLRLRGATREAGVKLLVGLDQALAEAVEADGLHLPEREAARAVLIRRAHPGWLLTRAWHGGDASCTGLDALVLSPVFPAGGVSGVKTPLGVEGFRRRVIAADLPVYALGGVDAATASGLIGSGACGLAGVAAIQSAFR
ncbi:thiamine phosphate synthase [Brevundimonas sp. SL130]|uniref:thiamine phosphate synthase n=1 Tax=Brevundimonas sp. SL130 TaxID=2995143 RepID=UPI00226CFD8F|nr:thiamine phosphate synthase [Brevundimonas sp. SL130]WAC59979.1 thiamine phosphate synthase [Brevundimonas sp. SL130]